MRTQNPHNLGLPITFTALALIGPAPTRAYDGFIERGPIPVPSQSYETPAVAMDAAGNYVIAGFDYPPPEYNGIVHFTLFDATGTFIRSEVVSAEDLYADRPVNVAMTSDGRFVIAWIGAEEPEAVYFRLYDALGNPRTDPIQASPHPAHVVFEQTNAMLGAAMTEDGKTILSWYAHRLWPLRDGAFLRRFDADGNPLGDPVRVAPEGYRIYDNGGPDLGVDQAGNLVAAWTGQVAEPPGSSTVFLQRFDVSGNPLSDAVQVSPPEHHLGYVPPALDVAPDGRFVIGWHDNDELDYYVRRFSASGEPLGPMIRVNGMGFVAAQADTGDGFGDVAINAEGRFVVTWIEKLLQNRYARRYDAAGLPLGLPFLVNACGFDTTVVASDRTTRNHVIAYLDGRGGTRVGDSFISGRGIPRNHDEHQPYVVHHFAGRRAAR